MPCQLSHECLPTLVVVHAVYTSLLNPFVRKLPSCYDIQLNGGIHGAWTQGDLLWNWRWFQWSWRHKAYLDLRVYPPYRHIFLQHYFRGSRDIAIALTSQHISPPHWSTCNCRDHNKEGTLFWCMDEEGSLPGHTSFNYSQHSCPCILSNFNVQCVVFMMSYNSNHHDFLHHNKYK